MRCCNGQKIKTSLLRHTGYENVSSKLVQALREAIETDLSDASERVVRCDWPGMIEASCCHADAQCAQGPQITGWRISQRVTQVRRKAEGAKTLVKQWLADWRDSPLVTQDPSHIQIQGKLVVHGELGSICMQSSLEVAPTTITTWHLATILCAPAQAPDSLRSLTVFPVLSAATIQELGQFYIKNGQRARLPSAMGQDLLHRLDAAAIALPLP